MNFLVNKAQQSPWNPPHEDGDASVRRPTIRITKIEPYKASSRISPDSLAQIKETWFGRLYIKHLKQYPFIRKIALWLWRNFYPSYVQITAILHTREARRWWPIVKLADYVKGANVPRIKVFDVVMVDTPTPKVIPAEEQGYIVSPHEHYEFPPIYVAQLSDAQVYGRTNLVFMQDAVICHDLYDFERDYTSEELHCRHVIDAKKKRMRLIKYDAMPEHIPVAAAFLDACATNYAHWLTEVLPRIAVFCSVEKYANIPIIVDDGLHPNIMESLALVVGNNREIIILPIGRAINVGVLYATSVTGYVPFQRRDRKLTGHSHGLFSSLALNQLLQFSHNLSYRDFPRKIYLRRISGVRKITNSREIEEFLIGNGYTVIEIENLNFLQQVFLFSNAESVIAPTGATLANAIFSRPSTKVLVIMARHKDMIYGYWSSMLMPLGIQLSYFIGVIVDSKSMGMHGDYHIDFKKFSHIIRSEFL